MSFVDDLVCKLDSLFEKEEPVNPEVQKRVNMLCKDIRILCRALGNYERGQETVHGCGTSYVEDIYEGSFNYSAAVGGEPGVFCYFKHRMHCLGPYWDIDRCIFYVDGDGKLIKFEDGDWVDSIHRMALKWRELLSGPGRFMSRSDIDNL